MIYVTTVLALKGLNTEGSVNKLICGRKDKDRKNSQLDGQTGSTVARSTAVFPVQSVIGFK
jgi:hypothetical protein